MSATITPTIVSNDSRIVTSNLFEYRVAPGIGLGLFARVPLQPGTILYYEPPLITIPKPVSHTTEFEIWAACNHLSATHKQVFDSRRDPINEYPSHLRYISSKLRRIYDANSWQREDTTNVFRTASRINHSCRPNARVATGAGPAGTAGDHHVCHVVRPVAASEELTVFYERACQYMTTAERRDFSASGEFRVDMTHCACELCSLGSTPSGLRQHQISDMRRRLLRHLLFILFNKDLYGVPSTIDVATQTRYRERYRNRTSRSVVLQAFFATKLCEAEGLMIAEPWQLYLMASCRLAYWLNEARLPVVPALVVQNIKLWARKGRMIAAVSGAEICKPGSADEKALRYVDSF